MFVKKAILGAVLCCAAFGSMAAGVSTGKVTTVIVNASNFLFFTAGSKSGSPACGLNDQWAISLDTPKGKSVYALLLSAKASDTAVTVVGTASCAGWGDREDVLYIYQ